MISLDYGNSAVFNLTIQDKSQAPISPGVWPPYNLAGKSVQLTVVQGAKDVQQVVVAGSVTNAGGGMASVTLDRTNSAKIFPGSYSARFEVLDASTAKTTVYKDTLRIL